MMHGQAQIKTEILSILPWPTAPEDFMASSDCFAFDVYIFIIILLKIIP
jgi:hypothetical protein